MGRECRVPFAAFTELVATAIANAESREELAELADEQAALRRVATLVAEGDWQGVVLDAAAAEMERALGADGAMLLRSGRTKTCRWSRVACRTRVRCRRGRASAMRVIGMMREIDFSTLIAG